MFIVSFEQVVFYFKTLIANYNLPIADIDPMVKQSIASAVISTVTIAVDDIQTKHEEKMLALQEMIEKSLLLRHSFFSTSSLNTNASSKVLPLTNLQSKATDR